MAGYAARALDLQNTDNSCAPENICVMATAVVHTGKGVMHIAAWLSL
jgi:hypothetical protein